MKNKIILPLMAVTILCSSFCISSILDSNTKEVSADILYNYSTDEDFDTDNYRLVSLSIPFTTGRIEDDTDNILHSNYLVDYVIDFNIYFTNIEDIYIQISDFYITWVQGNLFNVDVYSPYASTNYWWFNFGGGSFVSGIEVDITTPEYVYPLDDFNLGGIVSVETFGYEELLFRFELYVDNILYNWFDASEDYYDALYGESNFETEFNFTDIAIDSINNFVGDIINNVGGYSEGYETGYTAGNNAGYVNGYNNGYSAGYNEASTQDETINTIFNGILNIALLPINFFLDIFNFEILGINMSGVVSAILSICVVVIITKTITGKGGDSND